MKNICLYHAADLDGHCSGAIVRLTHEDTICIGVNYEDKVPWEYIDDNTRVYIVDFSFPMEDMIAIQKRAGRLIWIDHHKTAIEAANVCGFATQGLVDIGKAGCELTWAFVRGMQPKPRTVHLLGRYDV